MKFIFLFVGIVLMGACRPYPCTSSTDFPIDRKYFVAEYPSDRISSLSDFSRKIRRSELFRHGYYTSDTAVFYHSVKSPALIVKGWYNTRVQCGYFISVYKNKSSETLSYSCTLMDLSNGRLNSSRFHIPVPVNNLYEAEPYLVTGNMMPLMGRIGTKKEVRRQYREFKRQKIK